MADLARHAVGVDLVEIALRQALGEHVPDELARPRFQQPLAIRFLTAEPGPLPTGRVRGWGGLERVLAFPGVVQADVFLTEGEEIRPVPARRRPPRLRDRGRRHERRGARARRGRGRAARRRGRTGVSCSFDLAHYRELLRGCGSGRVSLRLLRPRPRGGRPPASPRRRPLARRGDAARRARARGGRSRHLLPDDRERLLQPGVEGGRAGAGAAARARTPSGAPRRVAEASTPTAASTPSSPGTTRIRSTWASRWATGSST